MITGCAAGASWTVTAPCPGLSGGLANEDLTLAPNPLPPNWTGWIGVSANASVPVGQTCCGQIVFTCGQQTVAVNVCVTACQCSPVGVDSSTWGALKKLYR